MSVHRMALLLSKVDRLESETPDNEEDDLRVDAEIDAALKEWADLYGKLLTA